jgi:hypothetical protein
MGEVLLLGPGDLRGRAARTAWPDLLVAKISTNWPDFDVHAALDDTYMPLSDAGESVSGGRPSLEIVS